MPGNDGIYKYIANDLVIETFPYRGKQGTSAAMTNQDDFGMRRYCPKRFRHGPSMIFPVTG
ncbi:hypothetical protein EDM58_08050 [Brevibacillus panacihumi]|uniref:Uncharacterized protein n=1 Tax=Brevibacillus panacihumi TaxID=497735 RepID=A0A3M8D020_9BACL|nr:hypothetical protein EDM58_08050 [Brevibacillus panacihumi]